MAASGSANAFESMMTAANGGLTAAQEYERKMRKAQQEYEAMQKVEAE